MPMFGLYHGIKNYVARHAACRGISYATALHGMPRAVTALYNLRESDQSIGLLEWIDPSKLEDSKWNYDVWKIDGLFLRSKSCIRA